MHSDKITRGGGPEPSTYDRVRHEKMRLRPLGMYGQLKIFQPNPSGECSFCGEPIFGNHLEFQGKPVHNWCWKDAAS